MQANWNRNLFSIESAKRNVQWWIDYPGRNFAHLFVLAFSHISFYWRTVEYSNAPGFLVHCSVICRLNVFPARTASGGEETHYSKRENYYCPRLLCIHWILSYYSHLQWGLQNDSKIVGQNERAGSWIL